MTRRQSTYRPQNSCHSCGYTWYPRGKDVSLICPNCGSYETGIDFSGLIGFLLLIGLCVGLAYYSWESNGFTQVTTQDLISAHFPKRVVVRKNK